MLDTDNTGAPVQVHEGVMLDPTAPKGKVVPMWIVNLFDIDIETHYISAFKISENSLKDFKARDENIDLLKKDCVYVRKPKNPFGKIPKTTLAKKAKSLFDKDHEPPRIRLVRKPIFTTIVTTGTDTFNGKYDLGFYEHERTTEPIIGGHKYRMIGAPTGVFLLLNRIAWTQDFIPTKGLISTVQDEIEALNNNNYIPLVRSDLNEGRLRF